MKTKLSFLLFFILFGCSVKMYAQANTDSLPSILNPEKKAEFKGGINGWIRFLESNLDRDLLSRSSAPSGAYKVLGNFLVDSTGAVSDIRIEVDPGYGAAEEFKRVLKLSSKKWIPAYNEGKAVPYRHKQALTLLKN